MIKHTITVFVGLAAMWFAHKVDYRYYSKLSKFALWISIPLLIYTFTNGVTLNEAARWIQVPIIGSFQPSDFASLALIVNLASMMSKRQQNIDDIKESLIPILFWCGTICGLIGLTNVSTAVLLFCYLHARHVHWPCTSKYLAMLVFVGVLVRGVGVEVRRSGGNCEEPGDRHFVERKRTSLSGEAWQYRSGYGWCYWEKAQATVINEIFFLILIPILFMPLSLKSME